MESVIGRGTYGVVWRGLRATDRRRVAVKVLRPELAEDPGVVSRFVNERRLLLDVTGDNVVGLIDMVVEGDTLALVMEYVDGGDLRGMLRRRKQIPLAEAVDLAEQVLDGLACVHGKGVVHRDVKPENVLLGRSRNGIHALVGDFGVARVAGPSSTLNGMTNSIVGTPVYLSPEVASGQPPSPASDLYAVGVLLYEMISGGPPFLSDNPLVLMRMHAEQTASRPEGCPGQLWKAITMLLEKDPKNRPTSAQDAGKALHALAGNLPATPVVRAPALTPRGSYPPPPGTTAGGVSRPLDSILPSVRSSPYGSPVAAGAEIRPVAGGSGGGRHAATDSRGGRASRRRARGPSKALVIGGVVAAFAIGAGVVALAWPSGSHGKGPTGTPGSSVPATPLADRVGLTGKSTALEQVTLWSSGAPVVTLSMAVNDQSRTVMVRGVDLQGNDVSPITVSCAVPAGGPVTLRAGSAAGTLVVQPVRAGSTVLSCQSGQAVASAAIDVTAK
ncbi:MAG: protein kinase domain-containing protein [Mycobacteriales bacterium]